jgi:hypothetical protein
VLVSTDPPQFEPGSFRDPDTKVFRHDGVILRCVTPRALADWERLCSTGFFKRLTADHRVIPTELVDDRTGLPDLDARWAAVLKHETVPMVSYPYEWPFSMLRDAALLQLDVTLSALQEGMTLKDATPYNIQWFGSGPTFIDIGSFTAYRAGEPWTAYRQFCELFLYPLLLQVYKNVSFHAWLRGSLEGIEAEQFRSLLAARDYLRPGVLTHVYLQAKAQSRYEGSVRDIKSDLRAAGFGAKLIMHNVAGLRRLVERLRWNPSRSTWSDYQHAHTYNPDELQRKAAFVKRVLAPRRWRMVWDLGCNTGVYSRLASQHADYVLALDSDHVVIDRLYRALKQEACANILPLVSDFADPSPGLGWRGLERRPLTDRGTPELILCLAVMHHLVIGRNIPLVELIGWLAGFGAELVIEFVGRDDPMVRHLLRHRSDQEFDYSPSSMDAALATHFRDVTKEALESGTRILYHAKGKRPKS